jgi:hypothetical protein
MWRPIHCTKEPYQDVIWALCETIGRQTGVWRRPMDCTKEYGHVLPPTSRYVTCSCCAQGRGVLCREPRSAYPCLGQCPPCVGHLLTVRLLCPAGAVSVPAGWAVG